MLTKAKQQGMSLVEMLVALAIAALLMVAAFPMYSAWVQNTQIRTGAEAMLNGLQLARSEAVSRNVAVQFEMTSAGTTSWRVSEASDPDALVIQTRSGAAGSATAKATPTPGDATLVTFNALGRVLALNQDGTLPMTQVDVETAIASFTDARNLRVTISPSGQVRMCDPDPSIPTGDSRKC